MIDALKSYVALATGLTEVTAAKAKDVASALVEQVLSLSGHGTEITGKVTDLADDLLATSKENREAIAGMVRTEVDRAIGRVGFVREDELAALRRVVQRLEAEVSALRGATSSGESASPSGLPSVSSSEPSAAQGAPEPPVVVEVTAPLTESVAEILGDDARATVEQQAAGAEIGAPAKKSKTWIAE